MSSQINPKLLLHRTESGTKRLREKEEHGSSSQEAFFKKMSLDSTLPTIQKLRLEAIFHPKFENEKSDQILRSQMLQNVASNLGYLEVTLKHSGSLVLWSGGRRFYSKNSTSNLFTYTAEILLKQHFERAWRTEENGLIEYENCSQYLLENRLTLSFEVVAHVLGDHGELPRRDFCMLTAIADRSKERFYSTPQILKFSQQFRLPHNDSWVFWSPTAAQALFYLYDSSRETGLAEDTVAALDAASESKVASMYPHVDFQGNILEGFIVRYIPLDRKSLEDVQILTEGLSQTAQDILRQVPPDFPPSFELYQHGAFPSPSVLSVNIRDIFQETGGVEAVKDAFTRALRNILKERTGNDAGDNNDASLHHWQRQTINKIKDLPDRVHYLIKSNDTETRRIAQLLQVLHSLKKAVTYKLVQDGARHICIIHVLHDETFPLYHKRMAPDGMRLFRGFSIELVADGKEEPSGMQVEDGIDSIDTTGAETLMLKMKMLPYMIRTFICRNLLTSIQQQGSALFQQQYMKLFKKWNISQTSKERWIPFLEAWAVYVGNPKEDLPPLTEFHYLAHLEHLSKLYESGATAVGKQISNAVPSFRGLVCVVSRTKVHAKHAATLLAKSLNGRVEDIEQVATGGVDGVYYGSLGDGSRSVRKALKEAYESNILVMVLFGLCQEDIENEIRCEDLLSCTSPNNEQKKCVGMTKSWRKFACTLSLDLAKNDLPKGGEGEPQLSEAFRDAVKTIQQVAPSSEQQSKQPGLFVFFPGIPGCGKSTLLLGMEDDLQQRLNAEKKGREGPSSPLTRKVFVRMGDEVGKTFWQVAKNIRRKDSSCILIADKNTPPASWSNVGNTCSETSGVPLPVLPDESIMQTTSVKGARKPDGCFSEDCTHFYPFSLAFLAVCMARVLDREPSSHAGKLDSGTPIACMIVVFFYSFYRYMSAEELQDTIESKLSNAGTLNSMRPLRIPFLNKDPILPEDLKEILVEALHLQVSRWIEHSLFVCQIHLREYACLFLFNISLLSLAMMQAKSGWRQLIHKYWKSKAG